MSAELAGIATALSHGIERPLFDDGVGYDFSVLIQGPGLQRLTQVVARKEAGASPTIVISTDREAARLNPRTLVQPSISIGQQNTLERACQITGSARVDVAVD